MKILVIEFCSPGLYAVKLIVENHCGIDSITDTITVLDLVSGNIQNVSDICQGDCLSPTVLVPANCYTNPSYEWTIDTGYANNGNTLRQVINTEVPGQFCYPDSGVYNIVLNLTNQCGNQPATAQFTVNDVPEALS